MNTNGTKSGQACRTPERVRATKLKWTYGITQERYLTMVEAQHGCCAICGDTDPALVVDHCHTTGQVRGLLCNRCNLALGHMRDNTDILSAAIKYLNR